MDKRFFLALLLTAIVVVGTPILFPGASRRPVAPTAADSARRAAVSSDSAARGATATTPVVAPVPGPAPTIGSTTQPISSAPVETTTVRAATASYAFSSRGGAPVSAVLEGYQSRRPGTGTPTAVQLVRGGMPLTHYRLALGRDTVALDSLPLAKDAAASGATRVSYTSTAAGYPVRLSYDVVPDSFMVRVRADVANAPAGSSLLVDLPRTLASNEPDSADDLNHLALSYQSRGEVENVGFGSLDSAEARVAAGPVRWAAVRNKYFLVAYRTPAAAPFSGLRVTGIPERGGIASEMVTTAVLPLVNGTAAFDIYAGPQDNERLVRLGAGLDGVNPVGGWFSGVTQPFTSVVMSALLWMKRTTQLNYGWVLVIFGVLVRLALWPLNQGAMRTSMKMQRLQPELQALQKKHAGDPQKQQAAIMKVYADHGMSPLSPLMGCLPMLLPMPILFALYHVFQNTIEFRGVSFLWLPDISLYDPYFITPVLMGVSMFVMSWMGMRGMPTDAASSAQAKLMMYMMPIVLTAVFWKFASGLNLYYAVQNVAALPQQWLLSRERLRETPAVVPVVSGPGPTVKRRS